MTVISKIFSKKHFFKLFKQGRHFSVTSNKLSDSRIIKSDSSDIILPGPDLTIPELIFSTIGPYQNYIAVECGITGKKYTFGEVKTKAINLGKVFRKLFKLNKGDVVAVHLPNCPDYFPAVLGILSGGQVLTTLNPLYTVEEISRQLIDSGAKAIITQATLYNKVQQATVLAKRNIPIITTKEYESDSLPEGAINFEELVNSKIDELPDLVPGKCTDLAFMPYSSGTTGLPKGVLITHKNLLSNLRQATHPDFGMHSRPEGERQDIVPMILPLYHIYGFTLCILSNITHGCRTVTLPKFTPDTFISLLERYKVTHLYAAPPLILFMTISSDIKPEHFSHLKMTNSGAAPLGYSDEIRFKEKINNDAAIIRQGYGLTETSPVVTMTPIGVSSKEENGGSIGKIIPNTMAKIIKPDDPAGTPLGPNEQGELLIKGPQVTKGYHNKPEETKNSFLDGWFRTGDMAYYNDEKFFFVTDRLKELIKVKGFQVPPAELEAVIRTFPAIEDAAVIGIPHPIQGELPRAYVVVKKDQKFEPEELQNFVASKVAKYKQLAGGVKILETIPKNPAGKILRRVLKEDFQNKGI